MKGGDYVGSSVQITPSINSLQIQNGINSLQVQQSTNSVQVEQIEVMQETVFITPNMPEQMYVEVKP